MTMTKQHLLNALTVEDLKKKLEEHREELSRLRVTQAANANATKVNQITTIRKDVARTLTAINQKLKVETREKLKGAKFLPKDLRVKATRAIRRRLTKEETHVKAKGPAGAKVSKLIPRMTVRAQKRYLNRRKPVYAVLPAQ